MMDFVSKMMHLFIKSPQVSFAEQYPEWMRQQASGHSYSCRNERSFNNKRRITMINKRKVLLYDTEKRPIFCAGECFKDDCIRTYCCVRFPTVFRPFSTVLRLFLD